MLTEEERGKKAGMLYSSRVLLGMCMHCMYMCVYIPLFWVCTVYVFCLTDNEAHMQAHMTYDARVCPVCGWGSYTAYHTCAHCIVDCATHYLKVDTGCKHARLHFIRCALFCLFVSCAFVSKGRALIQVHSVSTSIVVVQIVQLVSIVHHINM